MAKGIILVESRPSSPDREQEYNTWYDEVHLGELVALDGFVSARRLRPVDGNGPYVAIYEIEGDDLQAVLDNMIANAGQLHMSDALQLDPAPIPRLLEVTTECGVASPPSYGPARERELGSQHFGRRLASGSSGGGR